MARSLPPSVLAITEGDQDAVRIHLLTATLRVIQEKGLAAASTRAIAQEAGVSGGTLYNYFGSHVLLLAKSIVHYARTVSVPVADFPSRAGTETVEANLQYFTRQAAAVLDQLIPIFAAAFSDGQLLEVLRHELAAAAPLNDPAGVVERYLRSERELGRVDPAADCGTAASIVVSICHADAFRQYLHGTPRAQNAHDQAIAFIARSLSV